MCITKKIISGLIILLLSTNNVKGQVITTIAGNGKTESAGDGCPATAAAILNPIGITIDKHGNIIIGEFGTRIRKITPDGIITTLAGTGTKGFSGDNGPASKSQFDICTAITSDKFGNVFFADFGNGRIRKIDTSGIITTVAGGGKLKNYEGKRAVDAMLQRPSGIAIDNNNNMYIAINSSTVVKIDSNGLVHTIAGGGKIAPQSDGIPATNAYFDILNDVSVNKDGDVFVTEWNNDRIRKIDRRGLITTVAGTGFAGFSGDGGPATSATIRKPVNIIFDQEGNLIFCDHENFRVRKIDKKGIISTIIGNGSPNGTGDGGEAATSSLNFPSGILILPSGDMLISEFQGGKIRKIDIRKHLVKPGKETASPFTKTFWVTIILSIITLIIIVMLITRQILLKRDYRRTLQQQLELKSVYAHINPNFIFNTLGRVKELLANDQNSAAFDQISIFSTLLRSYIKSARNKYISIADEVSNLENYIKLQQSRFSENFAYSLTSDDSINKNKIYIPVLLLQLLVERAIEQMESGENINNQLKINFKTINLSRALQCVISYNGTRKQAAAPDTVAAVFTHDTETQVKELISIFNRYENTGISVEYAEHKHSETENLIIITIKNPVYETHL